MMLVPADFSDVSTEPRAPDPSATMAITAATPITTPSIVRTVRKAFRLSARTAIWALTRRNRSIVLGLGVLLFVAQRLDRIELRGLSCRIPAEEHTDGGGHAKGEEHRQRRHHGRPPQSTRD